MTDQTPTIRTADTDGDGLAKRRRRPALSCVECRSRKVKCDRNRPCGGCTQIRSKTCTYRAPRPGIRERSPAASASVSGSNEHEHGNSARSSPQPSAPSNEFDLMVNHYVAPGIFGEHGKTKLRPLPPGRPTLNLGSHSSSGDSALIESLLKRIHSLENKEAAREGHLDGTSLPIRENLSTPGQFVKSKYYGQSHWMNAIDPV